MLYPVYIHIGDKKHAHGVTFPDFPGCFAAADQWEDLPSAIQEAVEAHFMGEKEPIPQPTPLEKLINNTAYQEGTWLLAEINLSKIDTRSQRINITMPANLLHEIDTYVKNHHMNRSAFLAAAAFKELHG